MTRIEHNHGNKTKCCSLCGKSVSTNRLFQCEGNQDILTEVMYIKITENIDEENSELLRDLADKFRTVFKIRRMAKQDE